MSEYCGACGEFTRGGPCMTEAEQRACANHPSYGQPHTDENCELLSAEVERLKALLEAKGIRLITHMQPDQVQIGGPCPMCGNPNIDHGHGCPPDKRPSMGASASAAVSPVRDGPTRSRAEVDEAIRWASENQHAFPALGYSDGVEAALRWVADSNAPNPTEE